MSEEKNSISAKKIISIIDELNNKKKIFQYSRKYSRLFQINENIPI